MLETVRAPRQVLVGEGTATTVPRLVGDLGRRVLVLTDRVLLRQDRVTAVIQAVEARAATVTVFADSMPDVPLADVDAAVAAAQACGADVLLAIGGGTVIDLAKIVGVIRRHGGSPRDYYGECKVPGPTMPLVAVPTTSGTGSEVTPVSVLSDPDRELKVGVSSVHLIPDFAVVDPDLTLSCPPRVTAYSGIDAFCHAVECFTGRRRPNDPTSLVDSVFLGPTAVSDEFALRAARVIGANLASAVRDGAGIQARAQMSLGATLAGLAFAHGGTACAHAMQYPIGAATHTPHGLGVGLLLPYALTAVRDIITERLAVLANCVGLVGEGSPTDAALAFLDWLTTLLAEIGIPASLADIGVERADIPRLAEKTMTVTRLLQNHPGPTDVDTLTAILDAAWLGDRDRVAVAGTHER